MLHSGYRTLVVSTTNVAVDQALEKLLQLEAAQNDLAARRIIRIGQTNAVSHDVGLREIVAECNREMLTQLKNTRERRLCLLESHAACQTLLNKMADTTEHNQLELFADAQPKRDFSREIRAIYSRANTRRLSALSLEALRRLVAQRQRRIGRLVALYVERIDHLQLGLRQGERKALAEAKLVFSTMSNTYLNRLLQAERFDVVVIEEAGMAVLPALFYCSALAKKKVIALGDPRQLPPIVQSKDPFVLRAMGRNIFDITAPDPLQSKFVALLDTQYRMHPTIGHLISDLFYAGRLQHAAHAHSCEQIAALAPYPGHALVLVDTAGRTHCEISGRQSRSNQNSAQLAVQLAARAAESGVDSIGVITPYVEQARLIRQQLRALGLDHEKAECSTVHRFQGRERDLIILDTTDAAPLKPGILLNGPATAANLLNVSLSRARGKLIILADTHYFQRNSPAGQINKLLHYLRTAATCKQVEVSLTELSL
jgi:superfamily I DNA and/or RNA helicase